MRCRAEAKSPEVCPSRLQPLTSVWANLLERPALDWDPQRIKVKVAIIGSGPAAHTAAIYAGRQISSRWFLRYAQLSGELCSLNTATDGHGIA